MTETCPECGREIGPHEGLIWQYRGIREQHMVDDVESGGCGRAYTSSKDLNTKKLVAAFNAKLDEKKAPMKDWLGNELAVGDNIIYAAMSGRSVTMVIAEIVSFNESGSVTVEPIRSSRWKQHYGRTRWIDTRTGKGINPDLVKKDGSKPHVAVDSHYEDKDGNWFEPYEEKIQYPSYSGFRYAGVGTDTVTRHSPQEGVYYGTGDIPEPYKWKYVGTTYKDYVQTETKASKATLSVTENITKWTGELPDFDNKEDM